MIILIPLIVFVLSVIMSIYFFNKSNCSSFGGLFFMFAAFSGITLIGSLIGFIDRYSTYITNLATIEYCDESIDETTVELNETITINENDKIYSNKFSKTATFVSNHDTPIASTQEYLHSIQKDRAIERKKCLQAKRDVLSFKLGLFGFAA